MPFGAAGNFNFWIGNYHGANGEQGPTDEQMKFEQTHETKAINGESMKQFKNFLITHPGEFVKLTFLRVNKYFSIIRPMGFWFYQTGWGQFLLLLAGANYYYAAHNFYHGSGNQVPVSNLSATGDFCRIFYGLFKI